MTIQLPCIKCGHNWLLEDKAPKWNGTKEELKHFIKSRGRDWCKCYCGENLYTLLGG